MNSWQSLFAEARYRIAWRWRLRRVQAWITKPGRGLLLGAATGVAAAGSVVALEHWHEGVRQLAVDRPLTAGIVSGGLILAPAVLFFESWLSKRDKSRDAAAAEASRMQWRGASRDAFDGYLKASMDTRAAIELVLAQRSLLGPERGCDLAYLSERAEAEPAWFIEFAQTLSQRREVSQRAVTVLTPAVSQFPDHLPRLQDALEVERDVKAAAEIAQGLLADMGARRPGETAPVHARETVDWCAQLLREWDEKLAKLRDALLLDDDHASGRPLRWRI